MKKYLPLFILPFISTMALAQSSAVVSIGGGISTASSTLKQEALIGNGYLINANVFVPFLRKGWDGSVKGSGKFALGIIAGAEYNSAKNLTPGVESTQKLYKLYTGDLDITNNRKGSANSTGFTGLAGLQADFTLGKLTLSPSVSGAYFSLTQDGFAQSSQVMVNGKPQSIMLLEASSAKRSGFVFKPQFKVSYPIAGNLSFYAAGGLNIGPKITTTQSRLVPAGGFTDKNMYEPMQLTTGTREDHSTISRYQTIAVTAGVSWGFGGGGPESRRHYRGKVTKPGDGGMRSTSVVEEPLPTSQATTDEHRTYTGGRKNEPSPTAQATSSDQRTYTAGRKNEPSPTAQATSNDQRTYTGGRKNEPSAIFAGQPIKGVIVKGGINPGGNAMVITTNDNGEFELDGLAAGDYKFTITAPEEPAGKSISSKGVSSTKDKSQGIVLSPGNPIGGIIVKGGKNPGGSTMTIITNDNGEFELNGIEAGDYKFMVIAPEPSNAQATTDEQRTYTAGHRVETNALAAGSPIGGITVKGGKNPGGNMISVVSNNNGEIELKGLQAGDYKFTVTAPEQPAGKSINEKGISSTKGRPKNMVFSPGNPIGGIIVKGGKNPGGSTMTITTNNNGEFELNGIEAGDYKFMVTAPAELSDSQTTDEQRTYTAGHRNKTSTLAATSDIATEAKSKGKGTGIGGSKPGGAVSSSYAAGKAINTNGDGKEPEQMVSADQRTYTAGHRVETSALAAGSPIGGIAVKGGKNPGGSNMISVVSNNNGEIELKGLEAGDYKFTVTAPEQPAGKSINEKGIKRSEDATSNRLSMTPTSTKQTQGANFGEKVAGGLQSGAGALSQGASKSINEKGISSTKGRPKNMVFSPGNPIGGIIVKGGKNPGGSTMTIITNDNGEFELNGIEAGDYKFTITTPKESAAKGHSEKGIK